VLEWEKADPPWELPMYIGNFAWDLQAMQAWIATGGAAAPVTVEPTRMVPLTII